MRPRDALPRWTVDRRVTDGAGSTERPPDPLFEGAAELKWVVAAASLAMFVVALDFFSVQAAIPDMATDLDTSASALQWVISGYLLAAGAFLR